MSTVHAVLDRNGLVKRRKRRRHEAKGTEFRAAHAPNGLLCAGLVSFLGFDLGFFDQDEGVEPAPNPFAPEKVSTMSPE